MKIGLDLDGVLYPWHKYFYEEVCKKDSAYSYFTYEDFWIQIKALEEENKDFMWHMVSLPRLYNKEPIDQNLLNVLNELSANNELYYITSRPEGTHRITKAWVYKNKLPQHKNLFMLTDGKRDTIISLGIEYYLEDRLENYNVLKDITRVLLIKQPWNDYGKDIRDAYDDALDALVYLLNRSSLNGHVNIRT